MAIIYVDIDHTICKTNGTDYVNAEPIQCAIDKVNSYYKRGDTIVYWTARGTGSGIDWSKETTRQLNTWGAIYHELKFGKPVYDVFIDDKNINAEYWMDEDYPHHLLDE